MNMRAKLEVKSVTKPWEGAEEVVMQPVCGTTPFGPNGESEDNSFARWTPTGNVTLTITNPDLHGKFQAGQKFYADFTPAEA